MWWHVETAWLQSSCLKGLHSWCQHVFQSCKLCKDVAKATHRQNFLMKITQASIQQINTPSQEIKLYINNVLTLTSAVPILKPRYSVDQIVARLNKAKPKNCHADLFQKQSWNLYAEGQILLCQDTLSSLRSSLLHRICPVLDSPVCFQTWNRLWRVSSHTSFSCDRRIL